MGGRQGVGESPRFQGAALTVREGVSEDPASVESEASWWKKISPCPVDDPPDEGAQAKETPKPDTPLINPKEYTLCLINRSDSLI